MMLFPMILGWVLSLGLMFLAFRSIKRKRLVDDTPTSKTQGVFIGLAEIKGTAESEAPLTAIFSRIQCIQYKWRIEEQRTSTETYRDAKGHTHTRTRSRWVTIKSGGESHPFYLKDDTGVVRVIPDGAEITGKDTYHQTFRKDAPLFLDKGVPLIVPITGNPMRYLETCVPLHTPLYVIGHARERKDVVAAEIAKDNSTPMFLISIKTEKHISTVLAIQYWLFFSLGLLIVIGGGMVWNYTRQPLPAEWLPVILGGVVYLAVFAIGWLWLVYNSLIGLRQQTKVGWSQVDVELKRRHDLIPNLVSCVKGYSAHEQETQQLLTELRSQFEATPPGVSGPDYKGILPVLQVTIENYPELKANQSFLSLQKSLVETEQRIALARDYFNDIATFYNTRLEIVPDRFVARLAGCYPELLLKATDFERAAVNVSLVD